MVQSERESTLLVTGAASGIGLAVASLFVERGWRVLALDSDGGRLRATWGSAPLVETLTADITRPDELSVALAQCEPRSIEAVANIAGVFPESSFLGATVEQYRHNFDVNVLGTLLVTQAAVPYMRQAQRAAVVNFASTGAFAAGDGKRVLYKAAKAAVVALTRSMAFELAADGITVNALAPGAVETEGSKSDGTVYTFEKLIPLGRLATPRELATWVWALAGDDPLPYATGETVVVSGGMLMR